MMFSSTAASATDVSRRKEERVWESAMSFSPIQYKSHRHNKKGRRTGEKKA